MNKDQDNKKEKEKESTSITFRQEAITFMWGHQSRYTLTNLIPTYSWGYLIFICVALFSLVMWGIFGTVSDYVTGEGLILTNAESISNVSAPSGINQIKKIHVKEGQIVNIGDVIATLDNPELDSQIPILKEKVSFFEKKMADYKVTSEREIEERKKLALEQNKILDKIISVEKTNLEGIKKLIETQAALSLKGLIRSAEQRAIQQQFADSERSLENSNSQIIANQIAVSSFINEWQDRIRNLELQSKDARITLSLEEGKLNSASVVKAQNPGKIIHIAKKSGDSAINGEPIATISALSVENTLKAIIYIPGQIGKKVKPGMRALVSPTIIKKEEYGSIEGIIEEVSEYPVSPQEILSTIKNETIVKNLTLKDAPIKAIVKLTSINGNLKWSSSRGPEYPITEGTYVTTNILVQNQSPITLLMPALKNLLGVS